MKRKLETLNNSFYILFVCRLSSKQLLQLTLSRFIASRPNTANARRKNQEILDKNESIEAKCEFCAKKYRLSPERVMEEMEKIDRKKKEEEEGK